MSRIQDILNSENRINKTEFQSLRAIMEEREEIAECKRVHEEGYKILMAEKDRQQKEHKKYLSSIDPVNHPPHYTTGQFEVINILEDKLSREEFKGFLKGNILKYVFRADHKGGMEDYRKASFYLDRLIGEKK